MFSIGISLGAGILANYVAMEGTKCPLTAACCVGCHFDTHKAMEFLKNNLYGFYDYAMGYFCKTASREWVQQYDNIVSKKNPEKQCLDELNKIMTLSGDFSKFIARAGGFKNTNHYLTECTVTHRLKDIKVPTFFLSSLDDPFYGPNVIPQEVNNENVLIAVTKTGGHLCHF
jgi:predicted alpha/beta-fold hydrolase